MPEVSKFFKLIASHLDEYSSVSYRILALPHDGRLLPLRGWIVFEDSPLPVNAPSILPLGPLLWMKWTESLPQAEKDLLDRISGISAHQPDNSSHIWSLPELPAEYQHLNNVPLRERWKTDPLFRHYYEDRQEVTYVARRLYATIERDRGAIHALAQDPTFTSALYQAPGGPFRDIPEFLLKTEGIRTSFRLDGIPTLEIFAPLRLRLIEQRITGNTYSATLEYGLLTNPHNLNLFWRSYDPLENSSLAPATGSIPIPDNTPERHGRAQHLSLRAVIERLRHVEVCGTYRDLPIDFSPPQILDGHRLQVRNTNPFSPTSPPTDSPEPIPAIGETPTFEDRIKRHPIGGKLWVVLIIVGALIALIVGVLTLRDRLAGNAPVPPRTPRTEPASD